MAGEWIATTLGNCVRFVSGGTPSKSNDEFWGGNIPWVSAKDMKTFWVDETEDLLTAQGAAAATFLAPEGSTLLLVRGMTLHNDIPIVRVRQASTYNQDVKAVLTKPDVLPDYVPYLLLGHKATLSEKVDAAGHGTGRLALDALSSIAVLLPRRAEQTAIANLLGSLDDKIELNRRMAATLEEMARALFKSWFVDFNPVRAKAEGRDPGLPAATAALFPDTFGDDGLPVGWDERPFGDVFEVRSGNTPSTDEERYWGGDHYWATPKDLSPLKWPVLLATDRTLTDDGVAVVNSGLLPAGSVLISTRAPIGYLAFATCPVAINQGMAGIVGKELSTAFAWLWCSANIETFLAVAGGSTFPEISKGTLRKLPMVVPTIEISEAFAACVDPMVTRLVELARESDRLATLRDTLLPRLISGELRIKNGATKGEAA